mmetsp:Transcript_13994/g.11262  ORF Transcript_13994/g.11262 Transcript_13994/m.11262 type:complete len:87 (+) Transcript_13994:87-347(+)
MAQSKLLKDGELVLSASGALQQKDGEWDDVEELVANVWRILCETRHCLAPSEGLKRITVSFSGQDYIITGKDSQYYVVRFRHEDGL